MSWRLIPAMLLISGAVSTARSETPSPEVFAYQIDHQTWGDIGTFSNTIRRANGKVEVGARLRIAVSVMFGTIVLYREQADRQETWENGRLRAYRSVTDVDGTVIRISGQAGGGKFLVQRPDGAIAAPLDVFPTNLWSISMSKARTVMGTKSGIVVPVTVAPEQRRVIDIGNQTVETRYFKITPRGDPGIVPFPQEGWFDADGVPVRFAVIKDGKRVVFTMTNYRDVLKGRKTAQ